LYVLTGNTTYQDWGWTIFKGFEQYARIKGGGYSSIGSVRVLVPEYPFDKMESFFLAETLKYFYLLFGDRDGGDNKALSLDRFVLNTEAHFLPIYPT